LCGEENRCNKNARNSTEYYTSRNEIVAVISASNLSKSYGPDDLFAGISFSVPQKARAAIVGPNGIGKTTLLRVLVGIEAPTSGRVQTARGAKVGYLPQEATFDASHTLWEECLMALSDLLAQEKELAKLEKEMGKDPQNVELLERYGKLQAKFEHAGGYGYENRMEQVLSGLGFKKDDFGIPLPQLSGGQRTRALLARLLLAKPDLLILDEPTNHLDIEAVEWLENYLRSWEGAVLMVSHDRYFIDRVIDHIYEMSRAGFEAYRGNYTAYLHQREERWEERKQFYKTEIARMENELDFIRRNIAGQGTQMAKGKLSRLSRQIAAIETLGFDGIRGKSWSEIAHDAGSLDRKPMRVEEAFHRLRALNVPSNPVSTVGLTIRPKHRSGNIILRAEKLEIGYPTKSLFKAEEIELHRLECAALIGPNGSGKTTFLRTILDQLQPLSGEVRLGASLKIGYFAQAHEGLNPNLTLIEEIDRVGTGMLEKDIRSYLGRFLFSGDEQYKKVGVLSGGERGRLALAKLSLLDANFLLLDEPTNHLDIPGQEVLQNVLAEFDGTILLVSHDRYLIDALATQVWAIDMESKRLEIFGGTYSEYKGIQREEPIQLTDVETRAPTEEETPPAGQPKPLSKHERQRLQAKIETLEERILEIENELEAMGEKLQNPPEDPTAIQQLGEDYAYLEAELDGLMDEWERLNAMGGIMNTV
jgi:ATP-binding cassette subfamily F protein 3